MTLVDTDRLTSQKEEGVIDPSTKAVVTIRLPKPPSDNWWVYTRPALGGFEIGMEWKDGYAYHSRILAVLPWGTPVALVSYSRNKDELSQWQQKPWRLEVMGMAERPNHVSLGEWQPTAWKPGMVSRDPDGLWFVCCPCCGALAAATKHQVTEYADGTVGFQPSLICPRCGCHYFVRRSGIQYV